MAKYTELAGDILAHVGGRENVSALRHCITRLRFSLKDESKADTDYLMNREGVVTVVKAGGQYQVVIGNHVPEVYAEVMAVGGLSASGSSDEDQAGGAQGNFLEQFIDLLSGIFQPFLGPLAAAGIIKGIVAILAAWLGWTPANSGVALVLTAAGDGFFQFLPFMIALTAARRFKLSDFTALGIAAAMVYPNLSASVDALKAAGQANFFGFPLSLPAGGYLSTVIPAILAVWVASIIEKYMKKHTPDTIKLFIVPFVTLIVSIPLTFLLVGPLANLLSDGLGAALSAIYGFSPVVYGVVLGAMWQVMVIFGLHWAIVPLAILEITTKGSGVLLSAALLPNFTQTGVLTAIYFKTKEQKVKTITVPALISSVFGVTEPAIYGVTLPMRTPFIVSCIVSAIIGGIMTFFNVTMTSVGALGIFLYPSLVGTDGNMNSVIVALACTVLAIALSFAIMFFLPIPTMFEKTEEPETEVASQLLTSPLRGQVLDLAETPDQVFASGAMGQGVAIEPSMGEVVAPADGVVRLLFPTNHAIGLATDQGAEVLIHVGMDTVELDGKGFTAHVTQGSKVKAGQLLLSFDMEAIKAAGYAVTTPIIVTNSADYSQVEAVTAGDVSTGQDLLRLEK